MLDSLKCWLSVSRLGTRFALFLPAALPAFLFTSCYHRGMDLTREPTPIHSQPSLFSKSITEITRQPWTTGNDITTFQNGDSFYPAMLEAIRGAEKTITFETFAYVRGTVGNDFTELLAQKAKEGVKVHLIIDDVGSKNLGKTHLVPLRQCGVEVHLYNPWNLIIFQRSNRRTHRKILVVDGETAFTGGAGFTDSWKGRAQKPSEWRDTMYRLEGPAVAQLQNTFNKNWQHLTGQKLTGPNYFPSLKSKGRMKAQFFARLSI